MILTGYYGKEDRQQTDVSRNSFQIFYYIKIYILLDGLYPQSVWGSSTPPPPFSFFSQI